MDASLATAKCLRESLTLLSPAQLSLVEEASALNVPDLESLREGVAELSVEIRNVADRIIDEWPSLSALERTAALLALAEALSRVGENRDG